MGGVGLLVASIAAGDASLSQVNAAEPNVDARQYEAMVSKAITYLSTKGQTNEGAFSAPSGPGVTALVATAIMRHGRTSADPTVAKALQYLETFVRDDGGIYAEGSTHRNYETCLAIMCFAEANRDGKYETVLKKGDRFVKGIQWDEDEGKDPSDPAYGGAGYGSHQRPDLSNTSFLIEALRATGNGADDESIQRALAFVSRCQNLESSYNTTPYPAKNPDGGFYYTCAPGASQAGELPNGGLRSYASMTYAGLKSMIFAGVDADDQRVKAATEWISRHYDLKTNPNMGDAGLYYYYQTFAKALAAMKLDSLEDHEGRSHDWRADLIQELASRQNEDGSWVNATSRWLEGDPNLVTGYALLALSYCRK
ncbi:MAG: terpene cyclase/mutase family protein [Planctomycetales bacterium]|nr:terpene cyclase/mutase family protein [Planctomycetales bacterium]